jgi:glucose-6-phosphate 1-dehydrogenase
VDPWRGTETFAQVTLTLNNWRWAGVPFTLRTGKALACDRQEILVHFKPVPHLAFGKDVDVKPNRLRIPLSAPDRLALQLNVNGEEGGAGVQPIALDTELAPQTIPAYGRVLRELLAGDCGLSIRDDEAEESWRIVEPILHAWQMGKSRLREYPAGSTGPFVLHSPSRREEEWDRLSVA